MAGGILIGPWEKKMVYEFERDSLLFKLPFKQIVEV